MYTQSRIKTGCDQSEWARLFNLGSNKGQSHVSDKETGSRGVNMPEALASQLLALLDSQGFDVKNIQFDDNGYITHMPKAKP